MWTYLGSSACRGCATMLHWWMTPNNKRFPVNPCPETEAVVKMSPVGRDSEPAQALKKNSHWGTCVDRDQFKGPRGS